MPTTTTRRPAVKPSTVLQLNRYFAAKLAAELGPHNVKRLLDHEPQRIVLLDVRSQEGYAGGHLPGARNIPFEELPSRMKELPKHKEMIAYCWNASCLLCTKAAYILTSHGYRAREMVGGIAAWQEAGFPIAR